MKKKRNILIVIAIIAVVATVGGTMAAFVASTTTTKDVSAAQLGITIVQSPPESTKGVKFLEKSEKDGSGYGYMGMPGDTVKETVAVKTDKDSKESYIRVTINRSWVDQNGQKNFALSPEEIGIIRDNDSWIVKEDPKDREVIYCYYKKKVGADTTTDNVMDRFTILENKKSENSNDYAGYSTNITFEADAVQAQEGTKAMLAEWGIEANIDPVSGVLLDYKNQ
ncbi:MAG: hypothetical protein RR614_04535 [Eubacterium sp.]